MDKNKLLVVIFFITLALVSAVVALYPSPTDQPPGYGGVRQPTVLIPDGISVARYYDEESDVLCWIFTKRLEGGGFDVTSSCLPREVTDY